jgi:OFA family oxalate/formate antiporter-like MFS transporter
MTQSKRRWLILICVAFVQIFMFGPTVSTIGILMTALIRNFGWSHAEVSSLVTAYELSLGVFALVSGWLVDRVNARWVLAGGTLMTGIGCLIAAKANTLGLLVICYVIIGGGVGIGSFIPAAFVAINWFPERRALATAVAYFGTGLGMFVAPRLMTEIIAAASWRWGLLAMGIPLIALASPVSALFVDGRPPQSETAKREEPKISVEDLPGLEVREALFTAPFWLLFIMTFFSQAGNGAVFFHVVSFLVGAGFKPTTAATFFGGQALLLAPASLVMAALADSRGRKGVLAGALLLIGISVMILLGAGNRNAGDLALWGWMICWGIGMAHSPVVAAMLADALGTRRFGTLWAMVHSMVSIGQASGPIVAGIIFDRTGSYVLAFELAALAFAFSAVLVLFVFPARYRNVEAAATPVAATGT